MAWWQSSAGARQEFPGATLIHLEHSRAAEARDKRPALKPEAIDAIAHYLRGDFDFIPTADALLDDVRKQLDQLTQEQRIVLDVLHDSARVLVDGGAGTGKTLLAIEAAQRMARAGHRVLSSAQQAPGRRP